MSDPKGINNEFLYQHEFVAWMVALDSRSPQQSGLERFVSTHSLKRLETYQSSYLSRITTNLSETLFEACENLFGKELVAQVLAGYFKFNQPQNESLTAAPYEFPKYLLNSAHSKESLLFADLAAVCLKRWLILTDTDPSSSPPTEETPLSCIRLIAPCAFVEAKGNHDILKAWQIAEKEFTDSLPQDIFSSKSGLLICKTSPTDLTFLRVPVQLNSFVRALCHGDSVQSAIENFEIEGDGNEDECIALMTELMTALRSQGLLRESS